MTIAGTRSLTGATGGIDGERPDDSAEQVEHVVQVQRQRGSAIAKEFTE